MKRTLRLGTVPEWTPTGRNVHADVFVSVTFEDGRLSLVGVVGPTSGGDCIGGCGQITLNPAAFTSFAPGWSQDEVARLAEVWSRWHLNDMRAGCEHQRATWDPAAQVEVVSYRLTHEAMRERAEAIKEATRAGLAGEDANLTDTGRALAALERWHADRYTPPDADDPLSGCYEVGKRETKAAGWVHPNEHSGGLLGKACGVCGYKYGSAWLREEVPAEVIAYLAGLPGADKPRPWSNF